MVYLVLRVAVIVTLFFSGLAEAIVRHYKFSVVMKNTTKLCSTKPIVTVNGKFPGPTLYAREDDTVIVRVVNHVQYNLTIHWHGVRQVRTGWSDGPAYITQCPIQTGQNYTYNFTITGQRGEWWKSDVEAVINKAMQAGLPPNISDSHTINGLPGPSPNCSSQGFTLHVEAGKTYLLRIINAAVNDELFFKISGHYLTVVETDACYVKPFKTDTIFIGPGQTTNALLKADQKLGKYLIAISPFMDTVVPVDNIISSAILRYKGINVFSSTSLVVMPPRNATPVANKFIESLRSLNSNEYPAKVPLIIDHSLLFAIGVGINPCASCVNGSRVVGNINNVSFIMPTTALLQSHYYNVSGVFTDDFPESPPIPFNYTGTPPTNLVTMNGTRVYRLDFNSTVQVVLQGTTFLAPESHPIHLHGSNFHSVGKGGGNFDPFNDPKKFNLVDPVERNTMSVPTGGWTAIRFRADNPGVWFLHCHLEVHTTWGLKMAFVVDNGRGPNESILPPPSDLPKC